MIYKYIKPNEGPLIKQIIGDIPQENRMLIQRKLQEKIISPRRSFFKSTDNLPRKMNLKKILFKGWEKDAVSILTPINENTFCPL